MALSQVLLEYGERQWNPVLDVLPRNEPFHFNRKYPEQRLRFGGDRWRAYYHSHSDQYPAPWLEHGHFHVFFRIGRTGESSQDWTHVVALSMDSNGQPVRWFTVNNWVCGDRWLPAPNLEQEIEFTVDGEQPVTRWLASMVSLYQTTILALLRERDRTLQQTAEKQTLSIALEDRGIYFLSDQAIDLKRELGVALDQCLD